MVQIIFDRNNPVNIENLVLNAFVKPKQKREGIDILIRAPEEINPWGFAIEAQREIERLQTLKKILTIQGKFLVTRMDLEVKPLPIPLPEPSKKIKTRQSVPKKISNSINQCRQCCQGEKSMGKGTGINWVETEDGTRGTTINPILGCSKDGRADCAGCWAEKTSERLKKIGMPQYQDGVTDYDGKWTGEVKFVPEQLVKLLTSTKGRAIFLGSMGDIFHQNTDVEWQKLMFGVMALTPQNFYYLLSKRTENACSFIESFNVFDCIRAVEQHPILGKHVASKRLDTLFPFYQNERELIAEGVFISDWERDVLKNVILGTSCGIQSGVVDRVHPLFDINRAGWHTWISAEPMLQDVDFKFNPRNGSIVDWIVVGGESTQGTHKARPFDLAWAENVQRQCRDAGAAFWLKQLGSTPVWNGNKFLSSGQGEDITKFPEHLQFRERPATALNAHKAMLTRLNQMGR